MRRGLLISFEGLDGAGKTTQMQRLTNWLQARDIAYLRTREPGGTTLGIEIRQLLFQRPELSPGPWAEAFLFQADRAQHFEEVILPALAAGKLVITDRCFDSSIAYQGVARGLGAQRIEQLSLLATQGHAPDLTILLDLDPKQVLLRTSQETRQEQSHFDRREEAFHQQLRQAFLDLAQAHPERIHVIDAAQSPDVVHQQIVKLVEEQLSRRVQS